MVLVGTNNEAMKDPAIKGDKGVLMAFRESDGTFLWQAVHDKLTAGRANDWPFQGICSSPLVENGIAYYVSNRGEVVACEPTPQLLRRLDTRNVVVTPEAAIKSLPKLKGFEAVARPNGAFAVTYRKGQSSVEQVLAAVRAAGVTIADIVTEDPDLEDVFLALTYGDASAVDPTKD